MNSGGALSRSNYSVRGLANWILDVADELGLAISNMALNKLIFFAYESALIEQGNVLTNAKIEAWEHGPVFREVYQSFKSYGEKPIKGRASFYSVQTDRVEVASISLSSSDEVFLRSSLKPLISLPAFRLREISHAEGSAWDKVWWYHGHANPGMEITPDVILSSRRRGAPQ